MFSHWISGSGLSQVLAPDENMVERDLENENEGIFSGLLNIMAPDPNFTSQEQTNNNVQNEQEQEAFENSNECVKCIHCHRMTPLPQKSRTSSSTLFSPPPTSSSSASASSQIQNPSTATSSTTTSRPFSSTYVPTPPPKQNQTNSQSQTTQVESLVLSAAKDFSSCMTSPPKIWDEHKKFFSLVTSTTAQGGAANSKILTRIEKMMHKNPSLLHIRSSRNGNFVPDGFTPLHAAVYAGNFDVVCLLVDFQVEDDDDDDYNNKENNSGMNNASPKYHISLDERDIQGRTALHIASECGHVSIVQLLIEKMAQRNYVTQQQSQSQNQQPQPTTPLSQTPSFQLPTGINAPIDLQGRTPLACASMSRDKKAMANMNQLQHELFSPGDVSVYGVHTPIISRTGGKRPPTSRLSSIQKVPMDNIEEMEEKEKNWLTYGFADMPGLRIEMEDAICHTYPMPSCSSNNTIGFFGVFDGHGDGGISSKYIANHIVQTITYTSEWKEYINNNSSTNNIALLGKALTEACYAIDVDLHAIMTKGINRVLKGGCTGVMSMITHDSVIVGNVGDSRCILIQKDIDNSIKDHTATITSMEQKMNDLSLQEESGIKVIALSNDHKPNLPDEQKRIENAGFTIITETFQEPTTKIDDIATATTETTTTKTFHKIKNSSNTKIAVSRAFGDFDFKTNDELKPSEQGVVCTPEIQIHKRDETRDLYLILACDGVWDVMSNQEVGDFVVDHVKRFEKEEEYLVSDAPSVLAEVGDELLKHCLDKGSSDNMSVLIIDLCPKYNDDRRIGKEESIDLMNTSRTLNFGVV